MDQTGILLFFLFIVRSKGFSSYRVAFVNDIYYSEQDLSTATPQHPRRIAEFAATTLSSTADIVFSMTNREGVPKQIVVEGRGRTCTVKAIGSLDHEEIRKQFPKGVIPIPLKASDSRNPQNFAVFHLVLNLEDSNDNAPILDTSSLSAISLHDQSLADANPILRLRASDADDVTSGNAEVIYGISGLKMVGKDGGEAEADVAEWLMVDAATGNVNLKKRTSDINIVSLKINVSAKDNPNSGIPLEGAGQAEVKIVTRDSVTKYETTVEIEEQIQTPKVMASVKTAAVLGAKDDTAFEYSIVNRGDVPAAITVEGSRWCNLTATSPIDHERFPSGFNVYILARNRDAAVFNVIKINVKVKNANDNAPVFYTETLSARIRRGAAPRDVNPVLRLRAGDADATEGEAATLTYRLLGGRWSEGTKSKDMAITDVADWLHVDASSGNCKLLQPVPPQTGDDYKEIIVTVRAEDGKHSTDAEARIRIVH